VKKIQSSGGVVYELVTNFRSHESVLHVVNGCFNRLFQQQENVQAGNVPLKVRPGRASGQVEPGVLLRLVRSEDEGEDFLAEAAIRVEAEGLAAWLRTELERSAVSRAPGCRTALQPGHVALLFRKLTQAKEYLDALRRHGISYITDGEKHFYRRQEVIDLINVLRVVENPRDTVALLGVLRSPLGGVTDKELYELWQRAALECRAVDHLGGWNSPRAGVIRSLYERLAALHRDAARLPLPDVINLLFERLPLRELAAASLHGEQAVANLVKIRQMAADLADRPHLSLTGFVELMIHQLEDCPEEAEGALAEESLEAVRVMTIHKAKGLEFPLVILPGLHHGAQTDNRGREDPVVTFDWATGIFGISIGERCSLGAVMAAEKARVREEAEQRRLLYVGMTRAKERLVLSGALSARKSRGTFLSLLEQASGQPVGVPEDLHITIGQGSITQTVTAAEDRMPWLSHQRPSAQSHPDTHPETDDFINRWQERDARWSEIRAKPSRVTPSLLRSGAGRPSSELHRTGVATEIEQAHLIGTLAHRVLERWDFQTNPSALAVRAREVFRAAISRTGGTEEIDAEILTDLTDMLMSFATSAPYAELRRASILGREVPFAIPWEGEGTSPCLMEGVIDVLYQLDGELWVADYKTDRFESHDLMARAETYRSQTEAYRRGVSLSLGVNHVRARLLFLRTGASMEM
jgi:ATP-dependent helicase/nuclease subunit A